MNTVIVRYSSPDPAFEEYEFKEIQDLVESALFTNFGVITFMKKTISRKTNITIGRIDTIKEKMDAIYLMDGVRVDLVIFDFDLTAIQKKNLEKLLGVEVMDRTNVILTIFEINAHTPESIKQVEIAKLQYLKSHLVNNQASYSQVTSGSGHNKGVGEKQIELDRRKIESMILQKKEELKKIKARRSNSRQKRSNSSLPRVAIVGYTNAGKSTLMNLLLKASKNSKNKEVLSQDKLFATLETSTRLIEVFHYPDFLLTDTVGFIQDLPTFLVDAFRSTLEEIKESDLLIQVVDISSPFFESMIATTNEIIKELGANNIPMIYLYNKFDKLKDIPVSFISMVEEDDLLTSFKNEDEVYDIIRFISEKLTRKWKKKKMIFPYDKDFVTFQKENFVTSYLPREDGYECEVYLNPTSNKK